MRATGCIKTQRMRATGCIKIQPIRIKGEHKSPTNESNRVHKNPTNESKSRDHKIQQINLFLAFIIKFKTLEIRSKIPCFWLFDI